MSNRARENDPSEEVFASLLARARAGEGPAWEILYRWLAPGVAGYLRMQNAGEPDDLTSEVFLTLVRTIATFRGGPAQFRSFAFVIAHRRLQDDRRVRSRRAARATHEPLDDEGYEAAGGDAGDGALTSLGTDRVLALCRRLAADQRDVVLLRIVADLTVEQVADALGKSNGAVKQLQRRAFENLRREIVRGGRTPMNRFDDDPGEMPRMPLLDEPSLDDQRIEAILAGTAGAEHPALSAFIADVRGQAQGPEPVPSAALASLFTHGFSTEIGDLSATTASNVTGPGPQAAGLPKWRNYIMVTKRFIAGLSIAGKLAFGAGVAAAATGGAGTVGALPDPLQHEFAQTFDVVAPFELPDPGTGEAGLSAEGEAAVVAEYDYDDPTVIDVPAPPTTAPPVNVPPTTLPAGTTPPASPATTVVVPPLGFDDAATSELENAGATPSELPPVPEPPAPEPAAPTTTAAPEPAPAPAPTGGPAVLSLTCAQPESWTGVLCRWTMPSTGGELEIYLLKTGPDATPEERIWGDNPTSYVDVHADGTNTYTFQIEVRTLDGTVVGRSGVVTVTMHLVPGLNA